MFRGPQGQKRPVDSVACAVTVAQTATGEIDEEDIIDPPDLIERGRKGGEARARSLDPAKRNQIAKRAVASRWN